MSAAAVVERRHHRRVELPVSVSFRQQSGSSTTPEVIGQAKDVGLAGVYVNVPAPFHLPPGTVVSYSVEVPPDLQRRFPFTRLLGAGWIVRVQPKPDGQTVGVVIAFSGNATALSAA